jgi:hypothetical protein
MTASGAKRTMGALAPLSRTQSGPSGGGSLIEKRSLAPSPEGSNQRSSQLIVWMIPIHVLSLSVVTGGGDHAHSSRPDVPGASD